MWRIHDVFHASLLSPYHETTAHGPNFSRPPPDLIEGKEEQEIERVLDHRLFGRQRTPQYLIKWKGFPDSDNEWVREEHMHAPELIKAFHRRQQKGIKVAVHSSHLSILPSQRCRLSTSPTSLRPPHILHPNALRLGVTRPEPRFSRSATTTKKLTPLSLHDSMKPQNGSNRNMLPTLLPFVSQHQQPSMHQTYPSKSFRPEIFSWHNVLTFSTDQPSLSPHAPPSISSTQTTMQPFETESMRQSLEDWRRLSSRAKAVIRTLKSNSVRTSAHSKFALKSTKRLEYLLRATNAIALDILRSSSPTTMDSFDLPTGSSSSTTEKPLCWTKKATTPIPTSLTYTPRLDMTPLIPTPLYQPGFANSWQVPPSSSTNSVMPPPIWTTGEFSPTFYASVNRMTSSGNSMPSSSNDRLSLTGLNSPAASHKADSRPLKSTFNSENWKDSTWDTPFSVHEERGERKPRRITTLREDSQPNAEGDVTGIQLRSSWSKIGELDQRYDEIAEPGWKLTGVELKLTGASADVSPHVSFEYDW